MHAFLSQRLPFILIAFVAIGVYFPVITYDFVGLDDQDLITNNEAIHEISATSINHIFSSYDPELYVPLTLLTYQIEYALYGAAPWLFHLTNVILHIICACLVFANVSLLLRNRNAGFFAGLFFALHPINIEAVAWVSARKDVLSSVFFLLSLWTWLKFRDEDEPKYYVLSLVTFLLGLLSKVTVLGLPLILLLIEWREKGWAAFREWKILIPHTLFSVIFGIIAVFGKTQYLSILSPFEQLFLFFKSAVFTFQKLLMPVGLSVFYEQRTPITFSSPEFFVPILILFAIIILSIILLRKTREPLFAVLFFLITFAPTVATFVKLNAVYFASDRYAYLPSIAFFYILALLFTSLFHSRWRIPVLSVTTLVVVILGLLSFYQLRVWKNTETLYAQVLQLDPENVIALVNTAKVELQKGETQRAQDLFEQAVALAETQSAQGYGGFTTYYALGEFYETQGKIQEALTQYERAAERAGGYGEPHFNLGLKYQKYGRLREAMGAFKKATELQPRYAIALYHFAAVAAEAGELQQAIDALQQIVDIDPGYKDGLANKHLQNLKKMMDK